MTSLHLASGGFWAAWQLMMAGPAVPDRDASGREGAEPSFPATGAHWLDGWVVFGNTYV